MIITFCGHSQFTATPDLEQKVLDFLSERVVDNPADMFLGGYGDFDGFAYFCCKKYQQTHPKVKLVFVTPYITPDYQKKSIARYEKRLRRNFVSRN